MFNLRAYISETIELNQKRLKNLLNNFLRSFQIRKDPTSDIGTLKLGKLYYITVYHASIIILSIEY